MSIKFPNVTVADIGCIVLMKQVPSWSSSSTQYPSLHSKRNLQSQSIGEDDNNGVTILPLDRGAGRQSSHMHGVFMLNLYLLTALPHS